MLKGIKIYKKSTREDDRTKRSNKEPNKKLRYNSENSKNKKLLSLLRNCRKLENLEGSSLNRSRIKCLRKRDRSKRSLIDKEKRK